MTVILASTCIGILVKTTSLFDDKIEDIYELTILVKEDMANLTHQMRDLQSMCVNQNGA